MLFSIIVPIYNAEATLNRCLESIIAQQYKDFELLLIDDGSTDTSPEICRSYQKVDERVKVFHKKNGGVSSARNLGLDKATGDWIVFVDADDYISSTWLQVYRENIDKCGIKGLIVQHANIYQGDSLSEILHGDCEGVVDKDVFFLNGKYGYLWNKCFNRDVIWRQKIAFDTTMQCFEDEIFVLQYSQYVEYMFIPPSPSSYYYFLPDFENKYRKECAFLRQYYRYNRTKEISPAASTILVDWMVMQMLKECSKDRSKVKEYTIMLKKAVGNDMKYALGLKKCVLRSVRFVKYDFWWIFMVWIHVLMYKVISRNLV